MLESVNAIERLQKLRLSGAITDSEFEHEKAKILAAGSAIDAHDIGHIEEGASEYHPLSFVGKKLPLLVLALGVAGIVTFVGFDYYIKEKAEIPFSLPAPEAQAEIVPENAPEISVETDTYEEIELRRITFSLNYQDTTSSNIFDQLVTNRAYYLLNTGETTAQIEWVSVNERTDCLAVPIVSAQSDGIRELGVVTDNSNDRVGGLLNLKVGQSIKIRMPSTCGEPVRLTVGTSVGEIKLGP